MKTRHMLLTAFALFMGASDAFGKCEKVVAPRILGENEGENGLMRQATEFFFEIAKKGSKRNFFFADLRKSDPETSQPVYERVAEYTAQHRAAEIYSAQGWQGHFGENVYALPCEISWSRLFFVNSDKYSPFWERGQEIQWAIRVLVTFELPEREVNEVYDVIFAPQDGKGGGNEVEAILLRWQEVLGVLP